MTIKELGGISANKNNEPPIGARLERVPTYNKR
jgi:hypothetical protein